MFTPTGEEFIRLVYGIGREIGFNDIDDFLNRIIEDENKKVNPIVRVYNGKKFERIVQ